MRLIIAGLASTLALAASAPASAQTLPQAESFVRSVFAAYGGAENGGVDILPWSKALAALIARNQELAGDDIGYLGADPLCQCQDWADIRIERLDLQDRGDIGAEAHVVFRDRGMDDGPRSARLRLVREDGAWRIDDILDDQGRNSLSQGLTEDNLRMAAGG